MNLVRRHYVKNWDHMKPEQRHEVTVKKGGKLVPHIQPERVRYIEEEMGYWRKANAIHKWFVDNVQDGVDNCAEYYVSDEQLRELLARCEKVTAASKLVPAKIQNGTMYSNGKSEPIMEEGFIIEDPTIAQMLLPTQSGFFFGGTDYTQYYLQDIMDTKDILTEVLKEPHEGDIYYQSSW